jgi:CYTH domain-containing protein
MLENELSFLVKRLPDLDCLKRADIRQDYLSNGPEPLRLRRIGDRFELTKKLDTDPGDMTRKEELTIPLTESEYREILPLSKRGLLKTRYYCPLPGGLIAEIDVFSRPLTGLVMVEVEFPDESSRNAFVPPDWFGRDISQEEWATNSWLAGRTFEEISRFIR